MMRQYNKYGNILGYMTDCAQEMARLVASILLGCETIIDGCDGRDADSNFDILTSEELIEKLENEGNIDQEEIKRITERYPLLGSEKVFRDRLFKLIRRAWLSHVRLGKARRPDVLTLCCEILSNPENPNSYRIVKFSIVLALRTIYGVAYNNESLEKLRDTYSILRDRFIDQQRRRIHRDSDEYEQYLTDLLALEGWIQRSLTRDNLVAYYEGFKKHPFGIDVDSKRRSFDQKQEWPELRGVLPDFPSILNCSFGQPLCIPGLDDVTGGIVPALPLSGGRPSTGGQVTLVAGAPGTGKTSLCLSIGSRMSELGSVVRYITTEEDPPGLELKLTMTGGGNYLAKAMLPDLPDDYDQFKKDFKIISGRSFSSLVDLQSQIDKDILEKCAKNSDPMDDKELFVYLVFQRVLIIDSLTVLLRLMTDENGDAISSDPRRELGNILRSLRELGVCVFLVGGIDDCDDHGLAYLVDNVFILQIDESRTSQHPLRTLKIEKTRLQISHRGKHVFHLSRRKGCVISPSLHSVIRDVSDHEQIMSDPSSRAVLWTPYEGQLELPYENEKKQGVALTVKAKSQILVYGKGSSGKAAFGLAISLEPRISVDPQIEWRKYLETHHVANRELSIAERRHIENCRVLVVSFLYGKKYYEDIASGILHRRFKKRAKKDELKSLLSVLDFYPGFIDPETVVAKLREQLISARIEGRPFTAVMLDGLHNVLLQYPLLENERLLWPALYRILRAEGIDTISTFTFFAAGQTIEKRRTLFRKARTEIISEPMRMGAMLDVSQQIFFHLLVSSCDYTFVVEQGSPGTSRKDYMRVHMGSSIDRYEGRPEEFWWDPRKCTYVISAKQGQKLD